MASNTITVPVQPLLREITLKVSGLRITSLRLRIAASIFAFGSWVAGINLVMNDDPAEGEPTGWLETKRPLTGLRGAEVYDPRDALLTREEMRQAADIRRPLPRA